MSQIKPEKLRGLQLVTGEKGGVGKSLFTMCLLEYCLEKKLPYRFYDADRSSPDVGLIYEPNKYSAMLNGKTDQGKAIAKKGSKATVKDETYQPQNKSVEQLVEPNNLHIFFSEDEEDGFLANHLIAEAAEHLVIVNLPAQVEMIIHQWLIGRGILEVAQLDELPITFWFVTDGSPESLDLLFNSLTIYGQGVNHVVVINEGLSKRAKENFQAHRVCKMIEQQSIPIVTLPELWLSNEEKVKLKTQRKRLGEAADRKSSNDFTFVVKSQIFRFIRQAIQEIESSGVFSDAHELSNNQSNDNKEMIQPQTFDAITI
ncbi:hypothetical protein C7H19_20010 [Aphanothece hegewaldii CCALA 016]|uniref:CobQ/CobB/MinD/ParA nucleotide binding domain-containing protein n=1 Tax=Aphanothece hegewaldii CCALA 016 TaxID=2107694 RepID=A0A2T1LT12_9CHRO|nr:hypothetical protein [Aphanothece hegewaldii]PSF33457.1 hypothetical protein C7H19_20010 [Aphanothece hegewaldii CCALA 016]